MMDQDKKPIFAIVASFSSVVMVSLLIVFSSLVLILPGTSATTFIDNGDAGKAYAQLGMSPFSPTPQRVLPTYIVHMVPGAASKNSLYHYYPPSIAVPEGTTVAWFNDDPGQPHTVTSGFINDSNTGLLFNSGIIPYGSFFQYTFAGLNGKYVYHCSIHPWRIGVVTVSAAVQRGNNFELRTGTGPTLNLQQNNRTVFDFKPTTIVPPTTTPITYNVSLLSPNGDRIFSRSFFALDNDLQIELVQNNNRNQTSVYGPDVTDPITGTYHVEGNLFKNIGNYTIIAEITAIGNQAPAQKVADKFNFAVINSISNANNPETFPFITTPFIK